MEQTEVKRRSTSPPINGHPSSSWNAPRGSGRLHGHEPSSRTPTKPGSRYIQQSLSAAIDKNTQQPKIESNSDFEDKDIKEEPSPDASSTPSTPNAAQQQPKQKLAFKKSQKPPVQLIPDCPRAEKAALATFEELETNWHQYKYLGKSKVQEDAMACECQFKPGFFIFLR
jgi:histone-lysine N-methyltransferase SETD2